MSLSVDLRAAVSKATSADEIPKEGTLIAGKYRVEGVIGSGGMGIILAATHDILERRVAIKLLPVQAAQDPEHLARFRREAKALASVKSEHVVHVLDFGTLETGAPFIVMERLEGTLLSDVLKTRGKLPVDEAVDYVIQAAEGVAEAHGLGIVHRDLKPANLFVTEGKGGAEIKVFDFGASKLTAECSLHAKEGAVTMATSLIGSPRYMAPEQLKSALDVDQRVDVYALGATLHELLSGEPLFSAETLAQIFTKVLWDPPPSLASFRDDLPIGLEAVVLRALAKAKEERFQSLDAFVTALAPFAPERSFHLVDRLASRPRELGAFPAASPSVVREIPDGPLTPKSAAARAANGREATLRSLEIAPTLASEREPPTNEDTLSRFLKGGRSRRPVAYAAAAALLLLGAFVASKFVLGGATASSHSTGDTLAEHDPQFAEGNGPHAEAPPRSAAVPEAEPPRILRRRPACLRSSRARRRRTARR